MKTDRELLELAAKAVGLSEGIGGAFWTEFGIFDPLEDDGDALRLAVELKIGFKYHLNAPPEMGLPRECAVSVTDFGKWFAEVDRDKEKATRRAIVRAAAAVGEAMQ